MAERSRGGSIVKFIVVVILLGGLVIGGVYWLKNRNASPSTTQQPNKPTPTPEKPAPEKPKDAPKTQTPQPPAPPAATSPAQLPATGPEGTVVTLLVLGLLGAGTAAYLQSRRHSYSL